MSKVVVLPADIVQAISMLKSTPIDPNDFNNAVQECYNRGFGKMGKWIMDHKDQYLQALQDGYVSDADVPKSELGPDVPPAPDSEVQEIFDPEKTIYPPPSEEIDIAPPEGAPPEDEVPEPETATPSTFPDEESKAGKRHKQP